MKRSEVLEPVAAVDGVEIPVDQPLTVLDPTLDLSWWGFRRLGAAKVGAVELLYSPPHMLQISNQEPRPISVGIPRHPEPIVVAPGDRARFVLGPDGDLLVQNPDPQG